SLVTRREGGGHEAGTDGRPDGRLGARHRAGAARGRAVDLPHFRGNHPGPPRHRPGARRDRLHRHRPAVGGRRRRTARGRGLRHHGHRRLQQGGEADVAAVADGARQGFLKTKRLTEFQASGVLTAFQRDGHVLVWDCGLGESVGAIALAVLCVQEGLVEHVLVVCERNKVREWVADFETDTDLQTRRHHGSGRLKKLETGGVPPVLVTTYETAKRDLAVPRGPRSFSPGPLLAALKGKNILVVYDESAKLRNRSSGNYKAHQYALGELRKAGRVKVLGLTATPLERGYEDGFNQLRLIVPEHMPLVKEFESRYVLSRDP